MNEELLDEIVSAVLSEGDSLGASAGTRGIETSCFALGRIYPRSFSQAREGTEPCLMQSECVLQHREDATVDVRVRFRHLSIREVYAPVPAPDDQPQGKPTYRRVAEWVADGRTYRTRRGSSEREVRLASVCIQPGRAGWVRTSFSYPAMSDVNLLPDERRGGVGAVVWRQEAISGTVEVLVQPAWTGCTKIKVRISNETALAHGADPDTVMMRTLASTHIVLKARDGIFHSLVYPGNYQEIVETCENIGTWPVPVGDRGGHGCDTVVSLPALPGHSGMAGGRL